MGGIGVSPDCNPFFFTLKFNVILYTENNIHNKMFCCNSIKNTCLNIGIITIWPYNVYAPNSDKIHINLYLCQVLSFVNYFLLNYTQSQPTVFFAHIS